MFKHPPKDFHPKLHCAACYFYCQGKMLFLKRHPSKSFGLTWGVPAGKIENNETPKKAVKREVFEEVGLVLDPKSLFEIEPLYGRIEDLDYVFHMFYYHYDSFPTLHLEETENIEAKWLTSDEARHLDLIPGGHEALAHFEKYLQAAHANRIQ